MEFTLAEASFLKGGAETFENPYVCPLKYPGLSFVPSLTYNEALLVRA